MLSFPAMSQVNLVLNPSFETYTVCPTTLSQTAFATPWTQPTNHIGSSDYFNSCNGGTTVGVPVNIFGNLMAATGSGYAGFYIYVQSLSTYREYVTGSLSSSLVGGQSYVVSFKWALSSNSQYASNALGVYFSNGVPVSTTTSATLPVVPQSYNPSGNLLSAGNWTLYTDTFIAAGGETHLTIGSFTAIAPGTFVNNNATIGGAYMYVDDVSVHLYEGITGDSNICLGNSAQMNWLGQESVYWVESTNPNVVLSTTDSLIVSPTVTTTYWAIDSTDTSAFTVNVIDLPTSFVGNDTSVCEGDVVTRVVVMNDVNYLWSDAGVDSALVTSTGGTHWLEIESHGCVSRDSFDITYHYFPEFSLGNDTTICHYDDLEISSGLTSPLLFNWNTGSSQPQINTSNPGTYWVDVTNDNCTFRDSIVISYFPPVTVELGNDSHFCYLSTVPIISTTAYATSFLWSNGETTANINISASGTFTLTVSDGYCEATDSVHYDLYFLPSVFIGNDTSFCPGDAITLHANQPSGVDVFWSTGNTSDSITLNAVGLYWVEVSDQYCNIRDSIIVDQYPLLEVDLGGDVQACTGDIITLEPVGSEPLTSYKWSTGEQSGTITVTEQGSFTVTVSNGLCFATDYANVIYFKYPEVDLGPDTAVCPGIDITFDVTSPWGDIIRYKWFNGTTEPVQVVPAGDSVVYWVDVTNVVCTSSDSVMITLRSLPNIELGNDTAICPNIALTLSAADQGLPAYIWSTGDSIASITVRDSGRYTLTVFDGTCFALDSIIVGLKPVPPPLELEAPATICKGQTIQLSAYDDNYSYYQWQNGAATAEISVDSSGTYWVKAHHRCGVNSDTIFIDRCECVLWIPTAFTPESQDLNEKFSIVTECNVREIELSIYDRWGERVFYTNNINEAWDGTYLNVPVPAGAYGWTLSYKSHLSEVFTRHGQVVLIR